MLTIPSATSSAFSIQHESPLNIHLLSHKSRPGPEHSFTTCAFFHSRTLLTFLRVSYVCHSLGSGEFLQLMCIYVVCRRVSPHLCMHELV